MDHDVRLHIDGRWRAANDGRTLPVRNPATEDVIGTVPVAGLDDLDEALAAAERGFATWRRVAAHDRAPFGGVKDSGHGSEGGTEAIEPYLVTKLVSHWTGDIPG